MTTDLFDSVINNTKCSGNIIIKRLFNDSLSKLLSGLISDDTNYENFKYKDKITKSRIYDAVYKSLKNNQLKNNEYKEMISDSINTEGFKIRFILELFDREGYLERYNNNNKYPLFVLSREVINNKIKGVAVYDSKNIFSVERTL